jgi:hypothetical protein
LRGAILMARSGNIEEAGWLLFLYTHFGHHATGGYEYARSVYRGDGSGRHWSWIEVSTNVGDFRSWLGQVSSSIATGPGGFGNHRKYESLDAWSKAGTGAVIESYVQVFTSAGGHAALFDEVTDSGRRSPPDSFDLLYNALAPVRRFGRTARFDYATAAGRIGLCRAVAGRAYLAGATGPRAGSALLFDEADEAELLEGRIALLQSQLEVGFAVLEDAVCNWQKSPTEFKPFLG